MGRGRCRRKMRDEDGRRGEGREGGRKGRCLAVSIVPQSI